jgi:lipopolysaccharide/colanic/teichoic acid biosynthesis glycosyltransferase
MNTIGTISGTPYMSSESGSLSAWNFSPGKRFFDAVSAGAGLVLVSPLMAVIAIAVRLTSSGPALFRQRRVGKEGKLFEILKFRTMVHRPQGTGPRVTRKGDSRVTALGRLLRRARLDELPQLFNVLRGDMSLVGPRPDLPEFCQAVRIEQQRVFTLRPGLTGWATLHFRDEEKLLAEVPEEQTASYYLDHILSQKTQLDLEYANRASFVGDIKIIMRTLTGDLMAR